MARTLALVLIQNRTWRVSPSVVDGCTDATTGSVEGLWDTICDVTCGEAGDGGGKAVACAAGADVRDGTGAWAGGWEWGGPTPTVSRPFPLGNGRAGGGGALVFPPATSGDGDGDEDGGGEGGNDEEEDERAGLRLAALEFMVSLEGGPPSCVQDVYLPPFDEPALKQTTVISPGCLLSAQPSRQQCPRQLSSCSL
ncbi:hypothetical protein CC2G_004162 [Coprinopsis cinerea AmutBmut pab1-1]|nr:hypothetical protein CC2G_004162 [Coprinopsis cinerea AmutBmut pab1-1]